MVNIGDDQQAAALDRDVDLRSLIEAAWKGRWYTSGAAVGIAGLVAIVVLLLPDVYRAYAVLAPNQEDDQTALTRMASQYGGLASLAGINLDAGQQDRTAYGLEVLRSRHFIMEFISRRDLLVPLIAADNWDRDSNTLHIDEDVYDTQRSEWVRDVSPPLQTVPTLLEAYEVFMERLSIDQDTQTGFVTISFEFYSPDLAKTWVEALIDDLNDTIRQADVEKATNAIDYLNAKIQTTSLAGLHEVFYRLIEEETKTVMLANKSDEYIFEVLDPAVVPEEKDKPYRLLIVAFTFFLSGLAGIMVSLMVFGSGRTAHSD